jgi:putative salt-induced outer membrane protein YdiY
MPRPIFRSLRIPALAGLLLCSALVLEAGEPARPPRTWAIEVSLDATGRTGNREQFGTAASAKLTRRRERNTLEFQASIDRQETNNRVSADRLRLSGDYQTTLFERYSWYIRDEGGYDHVKDIDSYNIAGTGIGYDFIQEADHKLTVRVGLSHRIELIGNPKVPDKRSAGFDVGVNHEYQFEVARMINRLAYVPDFGELGDFRFTHDSSLEVPLSTTYWRLRIGVSNEYKSNPGPRLEKMDTTYFTRLVLTWR